MGVAPLAPGAARPSADQIVMLIRDYFAVRSMSMADGFRLLDTNSDGFVSWEEFYVGLKACAEGTWMGDITDDELRLLFHRFDNDGNGYISTVEFCGHYALFGGVASLEQMPTIPTVPELHIPQSHEPRRASKELCDGVIARIAAAVARHGSTSHDLFRHIDLDENGNLDRLEVERVVRSFQGDLSDTELNWIWRKFDADNSGFVSLAEFCQALDGNMSSVPMETKVLLLGKKFRQMGYSNQQIFSMFDRNNDGYLSRDEWSRIFEFMLEPYSFVDRESIFAQFDFNSDGFLSIQEFENFYSRALGLAAMDPDAGGSVAPAVGSPRELQYYPTILDTAPVPTVNDIPWATGTVATVRNCLSYARTGLTTEEIFRTMDSSMTGTLNKMEFDRMVSAYDPSLSQIQLDQFFRFINTTASGEISYNEFQHWFA